MRRASPSFEGSNCETDAFLCTPHKIQRDTRASQESIHGLHVPGMNPGMLANPDIPSKMRLTGDTEQGEQGRKNRYLGIGGQPACKYPSQDGINLHISLRIKTRPSYAV